MQANLPGMTLLLDWRSTRFLHFYRLFCSILDVFFLLLFTFKALIVSLLRLVIPKHPKDLRGSVALIVGSGHGIGLELAMRLKMLGVSVICLDIDSGGHQLTKERLQPDVWTHLLLVDLANKHDVQQVYSAIMQIGAPALIINNAALIQRKSFMETTKDDIQHLFFSNVIGPMLVVQLFLEHMLAHPNQKFHVVGVSSLAGEIGTPHMVPYSATRFAMVGFMEGLNYELLIDKVTNIILTTVHPFISLDDQEDKTRSFQRYEDLLGRVTEEEAVDQILLGIRRNEREIYVPRKLFYISRCFHLIPFTVQTRLLQFVEYLSEH